jgi:hypothetical protein
MVKSVSGALIAGFVSLALAGTASAQSPAAPAVNDAEFKCMAATNKAAGKFVGSKAKCVSKCLSTYWKTEPQPPEATDCLPPYAGTTFNCIVTDPAKPGKSAEEKFGAAIKKACDPATKPGTDCPECYSGGDCSDSGHATNKVQTIEGQIDSFVPGVACERNGAEKAEQACQLNTAKVLAKHVASVNKCYDKCISNARKGVGTFMPGCTAGAPSDAATQECLNKASAKSIAGVDKKCALIAGAEPDCGGPDNYPSGAQWTNLVNLAIQGEIPQTYCSDGSPSGAFLD